MNGSLARKLSVVALLCSLIYFDACASKHPNAPPEPPPVGPANPSAGPIGPFPQNPTSPPPAFGPVQQVNPPAVSEKPHITLVVAGAGVASFATVGLLKRLQEEDIHVDQIITTGWPTLFVLGYGFMRSIHDLEWFAMRLQTKDFYSSNFFELNKGYTTHDQVSPLVERSLTKTGLEESRVPIFIAPDNTEPSDAPVADRGDWKGPLLKTIAVPGVLRPFPSVGPAQGNQSAAQTLKAIDVDEARRLGAKTIVAIEMYDDYFHSFKADKGGDRAFRQLYLKQMRKSLKDGMSEADLSGKISLNKNPSDFAAKRLAIMAGYREGTRLARAIRQRAMP